MQKLLYLYFASSNSPTSENIKELLRFCRFGSSSFQLPSTRWCHDAAASLWELPFLLLFSLILLDLCLTCNSVYHASLCSDVEQLSINVWPTTLKHESTISGLFTSNTKSGFLIMLTQKRRGRLWKENKWRVWYAFKRWKMCNSLCQHKAH